MTSTNQIDRATAETMLSKYVAWTDWSNGFEPTMVKWADDAGRLRAFALFDVRDRTFGEHEPFREFVELYDEDEEIIAEFKGNDAHELSLLGREPNADEKAMLEKL